MWPRWEPEGAAFTFLQYVTRPSAFCRRLIRLGGFSCLRHLDGDKVSLSATHVSVLAAYTRLLIVQIRL